MKDMLGQPLAYGDLVAHASLISAKRARIKIGTVGPVNHPDLSRWGDLYVRVKDQDGAMSGLVEPHELLLLERAGCPFAGCDKQGLSHCTEKHEADECMVRRTAYQRIGKSTDGQAGSD